jgi:hypothetical protein
MQSSSRQPVIIHAMTRPKGRFPCLVCGRRGFDEEPDGMTYDICSYCGWEDDTTDPDEPSGANEGKTIREWRAEYERSPRHPYM